jgi:hypothetical protein
LKPHKRMRIRRLSNIDTTRREAQDAINTPHVWFPCRATRCFKFSFVRLSRGPHLRQIHESPGQGGRVSNSAVRDLLSAVPINKKGLDWSRGGSFVTHFLNY